MYITFYLLSTYKRMTEPSGVKLLAKDFEYMKTEISQIKADVASVKEDIKNIGPDIVKLLKDEYISKLEFSPYKEKVDKVTGYLIGIAGTILLAVLTAVLALVFK